MTNEEIFKQVSGEMVEMFELDPAKITMQARLFEDLDLDSIDAIDMAVKLQELSGKRVDEQELRKVRTVSDVVDLLGRMLAEKNAQAAAAAAAPMPAPAVVEAEKVGKA